MAPRRLVAALSVTQTVGYGALYYAFGVLLLPVSRTLGASEATVTGALTLAVLLAAVSAVPVGRWIDRHGARGLMTAGSLLGAAGLLAFSQVRTVAQLYVVLGVVGLASAMTLYEAAFAVLVAMTSPRGRLRALLALTVVAGFASSIFIPLTGLLVDQLGWRDALVALALLHAAVTAPLHAAMVPAGRPHAVAPPASDATAAPGLGPVMRDPGYWLVNAAFVLHAATVGAVAVHLVGYLVGFGHDVGSAAAIAAPLGVLSVAGRLVVAGVGGRVGVAQVTAALLLVQAAALACLPVFGGSALGAVACVAAFGLGFGVSSVARPVVLTERYGTVGYGTVAGIGAAPIGVMRGLAPLGAAALGVWAGLPVAITVLALCCAVGAVVLSVAARMPRPQPGGAPAR